VAALHYFNLRDAECAMNLDFYAHLQNKGIISDRQRVAVLSTNWSRNSIVDTREAGVLIESPIVAEHYAQIFDFDWSITREPEEILLQIANLTERAALGQARLVPIDPADVLQRTEQERRMPAETRWIARLTPATEDGVDALLALPLGLDVWERHAGALVVAASEGQLAEIERRRLARVDRLQTVAEYLASQPPPDS
jgi:hypothetical protein